MLYALVMLAALPCFLLFATERYTTLARIFAFLGFALATLPTVVLLGRVGARMNSVAVTGLTITVYHHLAVFHERRLPLRWGEARISDASVEVGVMLSALATPALWLGWYLLGRAGVGRMLPRPHLEVPGRVLFSAGLVLCLLGLSADLLWLRGALTTYQPAVGLISALLPMELGFAMLVVHRLRETPTPRQTLIFWGLFAIITTFSLARGMILIIIRPLTIYLLGWLYLRRRTRLLPVALALLAVLVMQPVKAEFRHRVWDRQVDMGLADRALLYVELIGEHWLGSEFGVQTDKGQSVEVAAARTGSSLALANVVELTPASVPHQWGTTYRYLLFAFIPRFLYPDKPIAQWADVWASVMYGYVTERGTRNVMIGLSQIAEAYINFGVLGAVLLFMVLGGVYRAVDEIFGRDDGGTGVHAVYLYHLSNLMITADGSLAQVWGGVAQSLLLYGTGMAVLASGLFRRRARFTPR